MSKVGKEAFLREMQDKLFVEYTEQQIKLITTDSDYIYSMSDPGTGKTFTLVSKLFWLELFNSIPGHKIKTISYTNNATEEIKIRHLRACEWLGISRQTVNFSTLHSWCSEIMERNHKRIGMTSYVPIEPEELSSQYDMSEDLLKNRGTELNKINLRRAIQAIPALNSMLYFDRLAVEEHSAFKETKMLYEDFTYLRKQFYEKARVTGRIPVSDIPLYTLELLLQHPDVLEEERNRFEYVIDDEFQDTTPLEFNLLRLLSKRLIVMGDIKQQIYGFKGASSTIINDFLEAFPDAVSCPLTQSFRCANPIVDYSKTIIAPNNVGGDEFVGVDKPGSVNLIKNVNFKQIIDKIETEFNLHNRHFETNYMFLYRNNMSGIPVMEELFQRKIPTVTNSFRSALTLPVINHLVALADLASRPSDFNKFRILTEMLPEFWEFRNIPDMRELPIFKAIRMTGDDLFEVNYRFSKPDTAMYLLNKLEEARDLMKQGSTAKEVFNCIWPAYDKLYLKGQRKEERLPQEVSTYTRLVASLVEEKTVRQFIQDELEKEEYFAEGRRRGTGVRCYTMHASKGTEADIVYILDADDGILPSRKSLERKIELNCALEAAKEVRNERSLVFVAATRAKRETNIVYTKDLSALFKKSKEFQHLDDIYNRHIPATLNFEMFTEFCKPKVKDLPKEAVNYVKYEPRVEVEIE